MTNGSMPMLGAPEIRRVLMSLILACQERLARGGGLDPGALISARAMTLEPADLDDLIVDVADLGFDSLARLELVTELTRWFGLSETGVEDYLLVKRRFGDWVDLIAWHFTQMGPRAQITFSTSGSTGAAKPVTHGRAALETEICAHLSGPLAAVSQATRVLTQVPCHHIYGFLWSVLLPHRAGWEVVDLPAGLPSAILRQARPDDLIIATPYGWGQMATLGQALPADVTGVSSGGPTTEATWIQAREMGLARLVEVFGSSETGGLGWRDRAGAPFSLLEDLQMTAGDLRRPSASQADPLPLQDDLIWEGPRQFRVTGRKDTVVQVAGTNVNLQQIRRQILDETPAHDVAIRLDGARLKAFVAITPDNRPAGERAVRNLLAQMPAPARPQQLDFGPDLPRSAIGKLTGW